MIRALVGVLLAAVVAVGFVVGGAARSTSPLPSNTADAAPPSLVVAGTPFASSTSSAALLADLGRSTVLAIDPLGRNDTGLTGDDGLLEDVTTTAVPRSARGVVVLVGRADAGEDGGRLVESIGTMLRRIERTVPSDRILVVGPTWPTQNAPASVRALRDVWKASTAVSNVHFVDPIAEGWGVEERGTSTRHSSLPTPAGVARYAQLLGAALQ